MDPSDIRGAAERIIRQHRDNDADVVAARAADDDRGTVRHAFGGDQNL